MQAETIAVIESLLISLWCCRLKARCLLKDSPLHSALESKTTLILPGFTMVVNVPYATIIKRQFIWWNAFFVTLLNDLTHESLVIF